MSGNLFGQIFRISTFGESHGAGIGVVIDGCPAGLQIDLDFIQEQLNRRRPGQSSISTSRDEKDNVEMLSGNFQGMSTGTPMAFLIRNLDHQSDDYTHLENAYRPGHADLTYDQKYGFRDHRGGGRSSARETAARVVAGAVAQLLLLQEGIQIKAFVSQVGAIQLPGDYTDYDLGNTEANIVRCPDVATALKMIQLIEEVKMEGDTLGGIISCVVKHLPAGLGEPVFDKLQAELGKAMLSINAVKGFEYGSGFQSSSMKGSEHNDQIVAGTDASGHPRFRTLSNNSGGIQGGISNGQNLYFRVAFKPVSTIQQQQESVDKQGKTVILEGKGRHDPCVVPRAVPIVEAMTALVLADLWLRNKTSRIEKKSS
ncbi:chorismate synthase [soil metagenome]